MLKATYMKEYVREINPPLPDGYEIPANRTELARMTVEVLYGMQEMYPCPYEYYKDVIFTDGTPDKIDYFLSRESEKGDLTFYIMGFIPELVAMAIGLIAPVVAKDPGAYESLDMAVALIVVLNRLMREYRVIEGQDDPLSKNQFDERYAYDTENDWQQDAWRRVFEAGIEE